MLILFLFLLFIFHIRPVGKAWGNVRKWVGVAGLLPDTKADTKALDKDFCAVQYRKPFFSPLFFILAFP